MTIPLGPLRLDLSLSLVDGSSTGWEELAAVGMEDVELAKLNLRNTRYSEIVLREQRVLFIGGTRWP